MGQKVNPKGFRIGITENHPSTWFANSKNYRNHFENDYFLRQEITKIFSSPSSGPQIKITKIKIEKTNYPWTLREQFKDTKIQTIRLTIFSPAEELKGLKYFMGSSSPKLLHKHAINELRKKLKKRNPNVKFFIRFRTSLPSQYGAKFIAQFIGDALESRQEPRMSFRSAMKIAVANARRSTTEKGKVIFPGVKGIKIQIGGRLNGAEMARSEWIREGCIPLHTLRADIDYSTHEAYTTYGILGIKVWVYHGPYAVQDTVSPKEKFNFIGKEAASSPSPRRSKAPVYPGTKKTNFVFKKVTEK